MARPTPESRRPDERSVTLHPAAACSAAPQQQGRAVVEQQDAGRTPLLPRDVTLTSEVLVVTSETGPGAVLGPAEAARRRCNWA